MIPTKYFLIFAGVNGAGKTTFYHAKTWLKATYPTDMIRVNSDEILREFGGDHTSERDQLKAMKAAVRLIKDCFENGHSLNQETTLAGIKTLKDIKAARLSGYTIIMFYIGVANPEIAYNRIRRRADLGGHAVTYETLCRRFSASLRNLSVCISLCDEVYLVDNSDMFKTVRAYINGQKVFDSADENATWLPEDA